ncbi:hypothetical protein K439DRAFT_1326275 [Ramaria rubella]|nr:hypothetical protein K439DRAFT_1326275 [Ramaria rubella]
MPLAAISSTVGGLIAEAVAAYATPLYSKIPYHTSALSGYGWVQELLNGHPEHIRCELGVHKSVFLHCKGNP